MDELEELKAQIAEIVRQNESLTAERDSLSEENAQLKARAEEWEKELAETKKLNFTLGRQVSHQPAESVEEVLNKLF